MRNKLIDWVDARCVSWGLAMRRLHCPRLPGAHEHGWSESVSGRIKDRIPPSTFSDRRPMEHLHGDALLVARALYALCQHHPSPMTINRREHLYVHYVIPGKVADKILAMGRSRENYYEHVGAANRVLANAMQYDLSMGYDPENINVA